MKEAENFLVEWCIRYLENRDMVKREIVKVVSQGKEEFGIEYKTGPKKFLLVNSLKESIEKVKNEPPQGIFILNNPKNIEFFIKKWKDFSEMKMMCYFFNPFSKNDKVWIINPFIHSQICDPESLEKGLQAMSEMVDVITEDQLDKKIS